MLEPSKREIAMEEELKVMMKKQIQEEEDRGRREGVWELPSVYLVHSSFKVFINELMQKPCKVMYPHSFFQIQGYS